jgi:hypothetical protein
VLVCFQKSLKTVLITTLVSSGVYVFHFYFYNKLNKDKMFSQFLLNVILIFKTCSQCKKCGEV